MSVWKGGRLWSVEEWVVVGLPGQFILLRVAHALAREAQQQLNIVTG
jgi:hypothetical protein